MERIFTQPFFHFLHLSRKSINLTSMKKVVYTLIVMLMLSIPAFSQKDSIQGCNADYAWKVNDMIMMFAPGMAVNFYDQSYGPVESWLWDFGDGTFSEEPNPMHIFTFLYGSGSDASGMFLPKVCLTIKTVDGCTSTICKTLETVKDTVIYPEECFAYFYPYRNDTLVTIPEVVPYSFKVSVPENTVSYHWDFGDGTTSDESNPIHSYDFMGGMFTVCLDIVTEDGCSNTFCTPVYVGYQDTLINPDCQAAFTYNVMESSPEQYAFVDLSVGNNTFWYWDFGDGTFSNEQNPVHVFNPWRNDSLNMPDYTYSPMAQYYKVCLTTLSDDNCKSMYCDYIYTGGIIDTIYPEPCPYFISITTSNTLGGNYCNGTASASLVDAAGNSIEVLDYYWSTGESGASASGLCVNSPYYVSITGVDGCQVVGSFAIIDYNQYIDPMGYWKIYGNGTSYDLNYAVPDSSYICNWVFSDGTVLTGENVNYDFDGMDEKSVTLNVLDKEGNLVYSEQITLNQATAIKNPETIEANVFPNPVANDLHIRLNKNYDGAFVVEVFNSVGQKQLSKAFENESSSNEINIPVSNLNKGIYYARVTGEGYAPITVKFIK